MSSRISYALAVAALVGLTACGTASTSPSPTLLAPSTPDGLPPINNSPYPSYDPSPKDPAIVTCRKDVAAVQEATETFFRQNHYYADSMQSLVQARLLATVPTDVHYGYDAPNIEPVVIGTIEDC